MKIIYKGRGEGKTTDLIKLADEGFYYIVCAKHSEAIRIMNLAEDLNKNIPFPLTYDEFSRKMYHSAGIRGVVIDNVEQYLQYLVDDLHIAAITINKEE